MSDDRELIAKLRGNWGFPIVAVAADRIEALTGDRDSFQRLWHSALAELEAEAALADQLAAAIGMSVSASTTEERVAAYHRKTNATRAALEAWRARRPPKEPT